MSLVGIREDFGYHIVSRLAETIVKRPQLTFLETRSGIASSGVLPKGY